jgi:uncharacterized membrane protein YedE/YeeE
VKAHGFAFGAGSLFAIGLAVGGMTQPSKVVGFLDVTGDWDPSLIFVMGGAILTYFPLFWWISRRGVPLFAAQYLVPSKRSVDARLLLGAALFGIGWGLVGFCPGPALVSAGSGAAPAFLFSAAMIVGMLLHHVFEAALAAKARRRGVDADARQEADQLPARATNRMFVATNRKL